MVEVTQEDREAAPAWVPEFLDPMEADMIFQALARHRIAAEQRARIDGFNEGIEAGAGALEEDARLCDCFARSEGDCACGAWSDYKTVPMEWAVEIVRALAKPMKGQTDA